MDENRQLSYAWANHLAWALKAQGVRHGDMIAVILKNLPQQVGYEPLYVRLPGSNSFQPLDSQLHTDIEHQVYRF